MRPKVLDPFAGGGAIPFEALRLGCETHAVDLNPVAHLIELCTLVYPQRHGQPDSRPVPHYIKRLIAYNKAKRNSEDETSLFGNEQAVITVGADQIIPDIEITESEYRKNPLAADVKYWGHWAFEQARRDIERFYPPDPNGGIPIAYLWARTVNCPNPACAATIPLIRQRWLCQKGHRKVAFRLVPDPNARRCGFLLAEGADIDFDPKQGTMRQGQVSCPFCESSAKSRYLQQESRAGRMGQQMIAVIVEDPKKGRYFRIAGEDDLVIYERAARALEQAEKDLGPDVLPSEPISKRQPRVMFVTIYGLTRWRDVFNHRQALALVTFVRHVRQAIRLIRQEHDAEYAKAVGSVLGTNLGRAPDHWSTLCTWNPSGVKIQHVFSRQACRWCGTMPRPIRSADRSAIGLLRSIGMHKMPSVQRVAVLPDQRYVGRVPQRLFRSQTVPWMSSSPTHLTMTPYRMQI